MPARLSIASHLHLVVLCFLCLGPTGATAQTYQPPQASLALISGIGFDKATAVSEDYRAEFARCDRENIFRGVVQTRKCRNDPNKLRALLRLADGSIYFDAKMGLDLDGSWLAWNNPGKTDLKHTWLQWCNQSTRSCQVDPDVYAYIVIPISGPKQHAREFTALTGVDKGDFALVIYRDRWVPAFVADGGPYNKLGEASAAVFAAVGADRCRAWNAAGRCTRYLNASIEQNVLYIVFPGSRRPDMTAENALALARAEACTRLQLPGCP
jgi:hypothetical protein